MTEDRNSSSSKPEWLKPKYIIRLFFALVILLLTFGYLRLIWKFGTKGNFDRILEEHFLATVGLPLAGVAAASIVAIFEFQSGLVSFEGMGFKFKGASGQIILWIFCFLAIVGALKSLW